MIISRPDDSGIKRAAEIIRSGGLVSFPTETVYGLGADALNPIAVARIFEAKGRPFFDPLIVHVSNIGMASGLVQGFPDRAGLLAERFWPGPLTIVLPKTGLVPDIVTSGLPTVAIRMPDHRVALDLIDFSGVPIAAPSANPFGYLSPTKAEHVMVQLGGRIDMILDGGPCRVGVESTVLKIHGDSVTLLRPGGLGMEEITDLIGPVEWGAGPEVESPGQLPYHYSPDSPVRIVEAIREEDLQIKNAGFLFFKKPGFPYPAGSSEILSDDGDLLVAASRLFSCLHRLDKSGKKIILAEAVSEKGLGLAIMDRLIKASRRVRNETE